MKIAFAGKGGVGKTSLCAWTADWLARQGHDVWLVDADTALSLGQASGLEPDALPEPLVLREDLVRERIGTGFMNLQPEVADLPETLSVDLPVSGAVQAGKKPGRKRLLVMGTVTEAGGGCACAANTLLKALLAHLVLDRGDWVLVDLEAGVEHLGRGTVAHVDGLVVVSEPSWRSLSVAAQIAELAHSLGLTRQALVLNRVAACSPDSPPALPEIAGLPGLTACLPALAGLVERQMLAASVLDLPEREAIDAVVARVIGELQKGA